MPINLKDALTSIASLGGNLPDDTLQSGMYVEARRLALSLLEEHPLELATQLVQQYLSGLNLNHGRCECCGGDRWENWADRRRFQELEKTPDKLRRAARGDAAKSGRKMTE